MPQVLYPLKFAPIYKEKVWGGRRMADILGRALPGNTAAKIGESWEVSDLAASSVSGGGGGPERSVVVNGPLAGETLNELMRRLGSQLLGNLHPTLTGDFPLLVKYLDAGENLSVQVHPGPDYCRTHPQAHLKSEAWYIVHAEPGAGIYRGLKSGVTVADFRKALAWGDARAFVDLLIFVPVKAGQCHYLPSGTCHAMSAGILAAEVQTPSDTTFRVFDWGRQGRQLHIEEALACMDFGPPNLVNFERRSHIAGLHTTVSRLCTCDYFRIEKIRMIEQYEQEIPYDQPAIWMVLQGQGIIQPGRGAADVGFARGDTMLLPAHLDQARVKLLADTVWLEITFPQALPEQIA